MKFIGAILCVLVIMLICNSRPRATMKSALPRNSSLGMDSELREDYCLFNIFPPRKLSKILLLQNGAIARPDAYVVENNAFETVGPTFEISESDIEDFFNFMEDPNSFGPPIAAVFKLSFIIKVEEKKRVSLSPPGIYLIAVCENGQLVPFRNGICLTRSPISTSDKFDFFLKRLKSIYVK